MSVDQTATLLLVGMFLGLVFLRVPMVFAIGAATLATALYLGIPLMMMTQNIMKGINVYTLLAVPFFILAGEIMGAGGISRRLIDLSSALVGWIRGGLAMVNIVASIFFGGISGSSSADTASIGPIMIPMMEKHGYDRDFSTCVTMASSVQGILIPPSQNMVIFSLAAGGVSIGKLFMGGLVPGLLLALALMILSYGYSIKRNYPVSEAFSLATAWRTFKEAIWGLITVLIVVVGVISGIFTTTESAAMAVIWAVFVTFLVYREIPLSELTDILGRTVHTISTIIILVGMSTGLGWILTYLRIPQKVSLAVFSLTGNHFLILIMLNILLLILGCLVDMASLILITTPILLPIVTNLGMDPVHFGVLMVFNLGIGLLTPPVGTTLFIGCSISKLPMEHLSRSMVPFYITMAVCLMFITFVPQFVMTLPNLLFK
ncbi:MAG: TRAP transporter large permease [Planctomycetota bacterium]|jgi:tripartite ATP-independent transporter DctM subunit|nr:TRAP transporter large permease [Planctomycetota bacterium]